MSALNNANANANAIKEEEHVPAAETCDVLVLGAGAGGIAAARSLTKMGYSTIVLEARSRVGGRAHTSDELGCGLKLDHGARWVHGASAKNRMVQLIQELEEMDGLPVPQNTPSMPRVPSLASLSDSSSDDSDSENASPSAAIRIRTTITSTEIPFGPSVDIEKEYLLEETCDDVASMDPSRTMTRIIMRDTSSSSQNLPLLSKEPSSDALQVANDVFEDIIAVLEDPQDYLRNILLKSSQNEHSKSRNGLDHDIQLDKASLQDILVRPFQSSSDTSINQEIDFATLCRDHLLMSNELLKDKLNSLSTPREKEAFQTEVMALLCLELNMFFDNWEGAPVDEISALYGLEGTMLNGGNALPSDGYGSLICQLAEPLLQKGRIRLQHTIVNVENEQVEAASSAPKKTTIKVRCKVDGPNDVNTEKIFRASACIVALPLGVLRASVLDTGKNAIRFSPPLPNSLCQSIRNLGIAVMDKVEISFPYRWWPQNMERFSIACSHLDQSPTYHPWTSFIVETSSSCAASSSTSSSTGNPNVLVCYLHGEFAKETELKTNNEIMQDCMQVLRDAQFVKESGSVPDPLAIHVTRWHQDPLAQGCWTFYGKDSSGPIDVQNFRQNQDCHDRGLFFAGEHTCDGSIDSDDLGCVHGAWLSGELAAAASLEHVKSRLADY